MPHNRAETVVPDPELPLPDSTYTTCATRQFPADSAHVVGRGSTDGSNYTKCLATDRNCDSNLKLSQDSFNAAGCEGGDADPRLDGD